MFFNIGPVPLLRPPDAELSCAARRASQGRIAVGEQAGLIAEIADNFRCSDIVMR